MCVIIANKTDKPIDVKYLKEGAKANPDGMGLAFVKDGRVWIAKSLNNFDKYFKKYNLKNTVWHFRIATHGSVKENNCHPFVVLSKEDGFPVDLVMFHNGILHFTDDMRKGKEDDRTDSQILAQEYLYPILSKDYTLLYTKAFQSMLGELIGYSKLCFLDSNNNIVIINEDKGNEKDGVWFSNCSAFPTNYSNIYYRYNDKNYNNWSTCEYKSLEDYYAQRYILDDYVKYVEKYKLKHNNIWFLNKETQEVDKNNKLLSKGPSYNKKDKSVWDSELMASTVKTKNAEYVYFHSNWYELDRYILENLYK